MELPWAGRTRGRSGLITIAWRRRNSARNPKPWCPCSSKKPWFSQGNIAAAGLESMSFEAIGLPILARDGESIWVLLGVFHLG